MTDKKVANRPERKPLNRRKKLDYSHLIRPGYRGRIVNETQGNIDDFLAAGYSLVLNPNARTGEEGVQDASQMGSVVRINVNSDINAPVRTAVLMEIPEEFYQEDQKIKQDALDKAEMAWNPEEIKKRNPELYGEMIQHRTGEKR